MVIETILLLEHNFKGAWEVQSCTDGKENIIWLHLWRHSEIQFQLPVHDVFILT